MYLREGCKNLFLMRHGQAVQMDNLDDRERPLTKVGQQNVESIGLMLKNNGIKIDLIITSLAQRALQTAEIVKKMADFNCDVVVEETLYFYSLKTIFEKIRNVDDKINNLLLVGHNPILENAVRELSCQHTSLAIKPGNIVCLQSNIKSWHETANSAFVFNFMKFPDVD